MYMYLYNGASLLHVWQQLFYVILFMHPSIFYHFVQDLSGQTSYDSILKNNYKLWF